MRWLLLGALLGLLLLCPLLAAPVAAAAALAKPVVAAFGLGLAARSRLRWWSR